MRVTVVAEEHDVRFGLDKERRWWASWCYGRWIRAFVHNPVPEHLRALNPGPRDGADAS